VRQSPGLFDSGLLAAEGTRASERSLALARRLALTIGAPNPLVIEAYLGAVSKAPPEHLEVLCAREGRIVFAPTIGAALTSNELARRRTRTLTLRECTELHESHSHHAGVVAAYDMETDALIFPTAYRARDIEYPVLHELGHALTMPNGPRADHAKLLREVPFHIRRHLKPYRIAGASVQELVWEALAEAYVLLLVGREREITPGLLSELFAILST
jgi:hypothetical protein